MSEPIWNSILQKIRQVPTPENTQAWSYQSTGEDLEIYWLPEKGHHFFDLKHHAACLSLGCLLEYIEIAARSLQFQTVQKSVDLQAFDEKRPVAVLNLRPAPGIKTDLEAVLSSRSTNRGRYQKVDLPDSLQTEIQALAKEFPSLQISIEKSFSPKVSRDLSQLEAQFFSYPEYIRDLVKNIIFNFQDRYHLKTGIFHEELSLMALEKLPLFLAKKFPFLQKVLPYSGIKFFVRAHSRRLIKSSQFLIFGTTRPNSKSIVDIGRAGTRAWLMLNKNGYAIHPMTALALQVYELNTNQLPPFFSKKHQNLLRAASEDYAQELHIPYPVWTLRFGHPLSLPRPTTGLSLRQDPILQLKKEKKNAIGTTRQISAGSH